MSCSSSTYTAWGSLECDDPRGDIQEDFRVTSCPTAQCMVIDGTTPSGAPAMRLAPGGSPGMVYSEFKQGCKRIPATPCTGPINCVKAWGPSQCGIMNNKKFQIAANTPGTMLREREYLVSPASGYKPPSCILTTRDTAAQCRAVACQQTWANAPGSSGCAPCGNKSNKVTYQQRSTGVTVPALYGGSCPLTRNVTQNCSKNSVRPCPRTPAPAGREGYASYL
jgi:hypothetical protein